MPPWFVIEYQRIPGAAIVPDVCVGSRSAVRSVVVASKLNNLKKVKRLALDESSRTSVVLVKILFREFLGFEPEWETSQPNLKSMLARADAALIIGDPAMKISRDQFRVLTWRLCGTNTPASDLSLRCGWRAGPMQP